MKRLLLLILLASASTYAQHSVDLTISPAPPAGVNYRIYRGLASTGPFSALGTTPGTTFNDNTVLNGTTYTYEATAFNTTPPNDESLPSPTVTASIPSTPPPPAGFPVGARVKTNSAANVRGTAPASGVGTLLGQVPAGALGTVTSGTQVVNSGGWTWIQVKFDTCSASIPNCTGYVGSDNLTVVTTPPPPTATLTMVCTPTVNKITCTATSVAIPAGTPFNVVITEGGLNANSSGVSK